MIQLPPRIRIFISEEPLDFRTGFNGTAAVCRNRMQQNPLDGGIFIFINRMKTMVRIYAFDGHGEWLATKRIAEGRFPWLKKDQVVDIQPEHIYMLLKGANPFNVSIPRPWKELT